MKTAILTTIFISSVTFFSGCTTNEAIKPEKKLKKEELSVYNIIGINNSKLAKNEPFIIEEEKVPTYHFITNNSSTSSSNNVIVPQERTTYAQNNISSVSEMPYVSNNVEIVSYGSYRYNKYQNNQNIINKIEREAKSFLGTRYVWGATGPDKFDCSGFTQWVFRDVGIKIPRVSRDQAKVGEYVSFNNLRRGDMIFFDTKKHKKGIVTHVGIYLGNGNFIHASSAAKKVVVFNFYKKPYYRERFLWGRRVVHNKLHYASNY